MGIKIRAIVIYFEDLLGSKMVKLSDAVWKAYTELRLISIRCEPNKCVCHNQNYILTLADYLSNEKTSMKDLELQSIDFIILLLGVLIFLGFLYATIISIKENESLASKKFFLLGILILIPFLIIPFINISYKEIVSGILITIILISLLIYLLPIRFRGKFSNSLPKGKIDERDIMFSRKELAKESEEYNAYYKRYPEKQLIDDSIRTNAGLLSPNSSAYHPAMFLSSRASFFTIRALKSRVDGDIGNKKYVYSKEEITKYIKNWAVKLGALDIGITELKDYHTYSHRGRVGIYGNKVNLNHKYAIAYTVEMDFDNVRRGPLAPIVMESAQQYLESGAIGIQLAEFIRSLGYPAKAHIDGNYEVVCPIVAKDAGLGEIGRMGLLMTPKLGPRVRLAVVTTDIPLNVDSNGYDPSVIEFCTNCKKCAVVCPSNSISTINQEEINGVMRWQINQETCFDFWTKTGTDCGRCMSVCPYSHPDNPLHNIVRFGIKNSSIFSRIALTLDDVIYGKKPPVKKPADWMNIREDKE